MIWQCWCGQTIEEAATYVIDKEGKRTRVQATPDLKDHDNPSNPASGYWSVEHKMEFCSADHSFKAHEADYDHIQLRLAMGSSEHI